MKIITSNSHEPFLKLADVRFNPEELASMRSEGIYMVNDPDIAEPDTMQDVTSSKTKIRAIVNKITLPKIMFPTPDNIVELDGHQYYMIHISKPVPKKNPEGTISLLDIDTGEPIKRPFMAVAERLREVKREKIGQSVQQLNTVVKKWNEAIDKIQAGSQIINPSTWPLQLLWTENVVKERIAQLEGQEQAIRSKLDTHSNFSPAYSNTLNRMKSELVEGLIPPADLYDTIMFIQHSDPDAIEDILASPNMAESDKAKVRSLIGLRDEARQLAKEKRERADAERLETSTAPATEEKIEGMLSPGEQGFSPVTDQSVDNYNIIMTPNAYYSPQGRVNQDRAKLIEIKKTKDELINVRSALDGMAGFVGRLAKGERAKAVLMDSERGTEIKKQVANFLHTATGFIRSYKIPVFIPRDDSIGNQLNPKLLGTTGGMGNGGVVLALTHMSNVVMSGLAAYAGQTPASPEQAVAEMPENVADYMMQPQDVPV
jgi:hypothetical protein